MLIVNIVTICAFVYISNLVGTVFLGELKKSNILNPVLTTICVITISYHFILSGAEKYIAAAFIGFFIAAAMNSYTRPPKKKSNGKSNKVNP